MGIAGSVVATGCFDGNQRIGGGGAVQWGCCGCRIGGGHSRFGVNDRIIGSGNISYCCTSVGVKSCYRGQVMGAW